jgi:hypothetical protein
MRESDIQRKILKYLESQGGYAVKVVVANRSGVPDILYCLDGEFWAFEVKSPQGKQPPLQARHQTQNQKAGGKYFVVCSIEEVKQILGEYVKRKGNLQPTPN